MSREDYYIVGYAVALISEFAAKFGILPKQAYNYMKRFQGLDYLSETEKEEFRLLSEAAYEWECKTDPHPWQMKPDLVTII